MISDCYVYSLAAYHLKKPRRNCFRTRHPVTDPVHHQRVSLSLPLLNRGTPLQNPPSQNSTVCFLASSFFFNRWFIYRYEHLHSETRLHFPEMGSPPEPHYAPSSYSSKRRRVLREISVTEPGDVRHQRLTE